jgi:cell fate regulator YaaT (PSP1 superfamily)
MQISTCDAWNVNGYELMISKTQWINFYSFGHLMVNKFHSSVQGTTRGSIIHNLGRSSHMVTNELETHSEV